jgi:dCTP deaminase
MSEPTTKAEGILPDSAIRALMAGGGILLSEPATQAQVQPASLDLRLGPRATRVRASFLPGPSVSVAQKLVDFGLHDFDITGGAVLETGCV